MKTFVQRIIDQSSVLAAGLGVVLSPIPLADEVLLLPLLGTMTVRIGRAHGVGWREIPWKAVGKTAAGALVARAAVNLGVSFIPFVAAAANAASAATLTGTFGAYADRVCGDPTQAHAETVEELKVDVHQLTDHWRTLYRVVTSGSAESDGRAGETRPQASEQGIARNESTTRPQATSTPASPVTTSKDCVMPAGPAAEQVRMDIERSLRTRSFGEGEVLFVVEDKAKRAGAKLWGHLKQHPYGGIGAASALGFAVASATGVGELAIAVVCGYAAFEVLRRGEPVAVAVEGVVKDVCKMA
jgi:uncharacterized protein (DUF697 family)/ElaB/YqjD/DUF883 family membrane-anchored ribosome-binding protein